MVSARLATNVVLAVLWATQATGAFAVPIRSAAQATDGSVWAIGQDDHEGVYRLSGTSWVRTPFSLGDGWHGVALRRAEDGRLYSVWQHEAPQVHGKPVGNGQWKIAVTTGQSTRVIASGDGKPCEDNALTIDAGIYCDPNGDKWLVSQLAPYLQRIPAQGKPQAFAFPGDWWVGGPIDQNPLSIVQIQRSTLDGRGRRWFWTDRYGGYADVAEVQGVLIWDGHRLQHRKSLPGIPAGIISQIMPIDNRSLWVATEGGLYRYDLAADRGEKVTPPEKGAFENITNIARVGEDIYCDDNAVTPDPRSQTLWRLRAGKWTKLCHGADKSETAYFDLKKRDHAEFGKYVITQAFGGGFWYLPRSNGTAVPCDWHNGFPIDYVANVFAVGGGRVVAVGKDQIAAIPSEPPAARPGPAVYGTLYFSPRPIQDAENNIWAFRTIDSLLSKWDGRRWTGYKPPQGFDGVDAMLTDSQNAIWLIWNDVKKPLARLGTDGKWTVYASPDDAWRAMASVAGYRLRDATYFYAPAFSGHGRVAYATTRGGEKDKVGLIREYDGTKWRDLPFVAEEEAGPQAVWIYVNAVYYNAAGDVCVAQANRLWRYDANSGWQITTDSPPDMPQPQDGSDPVLVSSAVDGLGTTWRLSHHTLTRQGFGLTVDVTPDCNPFLIDRQVSKAFVDPVGNTMLFTDCGGYQELVLVPSAPASNPKVNVFQTTLATATVSIVGGRQLYWRLDGAAWTPIPASGKINLDYLPSGTHKVEAITVDKRLRITSNPTAAEIKIVTDPQEQIKTLVDKLLTGNNKTREEAVKRIVPFGAQALPQLRQSRVTADDDQKWWIDAVMQQLPDDSQIQPTDRKESNN